MTKDFETIKQIEDAVAFCDKVSKQYRLGLHCMKLEGEYPAYAFFRSENSDLLLVGIIPEVDTKHPVVARIAYDKTYHEHYLSRQASPLSDKVSLFTLLLTAALNSRLGRQFLIYEKMDESQAIIIVGHRELGKWKFEWDAIVVWDAKKGFITPEEWDERTSQAKFTQFWEAELT